MLFYICLPRGGFVASRSGKLSLNVRMALPFTSFQEADDFAHSFHGRLAYVILSTCQFNDTGLWASVREAVERDRESALESARGAVHHSILQGRFAS